MAQKLNEVELEDVSGGGCDGHACFSKLYCYDYNNTLIKTISTDSANNENSANDIRDQKISELFFTNSNIQYIHWELFKDGSVINEGTKYR